VRPRVAVIALGAANRHSIAGAIERAGGAAYFADEPAKILAANALVVPGVANFGYLIDAIDGRGLREHILAAVGAGTPFLGICAGFQVLFEGSDEAPKAPGLSLFTGVVRRLAGPKSPHMGWNRVHVICTDSPSRWAYFAHAYAPPADVPDATAVTHYGENFASIGSRDRVVGVQFHPERSGCYGTELLERFVALARASHAR
jgi:imidazole glycerol-phosphate synthase subunit HisH